MRPRGLFLATTGIVVVAILAALVAFSFYELVAGASASGSAKPRAAGDLDLSSQATGVAPTDTGGSSLGATAASSSIYPAPLGSARCWMKQGRVQPGQSPEFKVQVRDTAGQNVAGVPVAFAIAGQTNVTGSTVSPVGASTATGGIASTTAAVGSLTDTAGFVQVSAVAGGGSNTVSCQAVILVR